MIRGLLLMLFAVATTGFALENGVLFSCNFRKDTCGMENQDGARAYWNRTYLRLGGKRGYAMAVKGNDAQNHFARFLTPQFDTRGAQSGCLMFRYFIDGLVPASLSCIKQGFVTKYVFGTAKKTQDRWAQAEVDVEFLGDKVMFYFEADTKVQDFGNSIVAFTDLRITDKTCSNYHPRPPRRYKA